MIPLFTYGTLQDPAVQRAVIGRLIRGDPDVLYGYGIVQVRLTNGAYPMLVEQAGGQVQGLVIAVTEAELARIDIYETAAYTRVEVTLACGRRAWVYRQAQASGVDDMLHQKTQDG
jgi:gamma-glutamylcyclotransferase (GGCT)/AIG2-like uncharacterized protein YtfP